MSPAFLADMDLQRVIRDGVVRRRPRAYFEDANQAGLDGLEDPSVLELAAAKDLILVTHDLSTMPVHFRKFVRSHSSPGLLLIPQRFPVSLAVDQLVLVWETTEAEEWIDRVVYVPTLADFV